MTPAAFKATRTELGLTQAELSAILHVDPSTIRRWEMDLTTKNHRPIPPLVASIMAEPVIINILRKNLAKDI